VVQVDIEGDFGNGCNIKYAAVRMEDSQLVDALFLAYEQGRSIQVLLNANDLYYGDRCTITTVKLGH